MPATETPQSPLLSGPKRIKNQASKAPRAVHAWITGTRSYKGQIVIPAWECAHKHRTREGAQKCAKAFLASDPDRRSW